MTKIGKSDNSVQIKYEYRHQRYLCNSSYLKNLNKYIDKNMDSKLDLVKSLNRQQPNVKYIAFSEIGRSLPPFGTPNFTRREQILRLLIFIIFGGASL